MAEDVDEDQDINKDELRSIMVRILMMTRRSQRTMDDHCDQACGC